MTPKEAKKRGIWYGCVIHGSGGASRSFSEAGRLSDRHSGGRMTYPMLHYDSEEPFPGETRCRIRRVAE